MTGEVFVSFSSPIKIPANYINFDESVLQVELKDSEGKKVNYNFTWKITRFTSTGFKI